MSAEHVLLFTDAVDSTAITEALGDSAASALWTAHDHIVRRSLRKRGGREIDKSDGFLLLFDSADAAVACADDLHRDFALLEPPLRCRAGIHRGTLVQRAIAADEQALGAKAFEVDGIAKAAAARIMALAEGGQTLLSASAKAAITGGDWALTLLGHWRMKGFAEPIELFEVTRPDAAPHPPPDSPKAYRVVRSGDGWTPVAQLRHGLPAERDAFIGRGAALSALAACFDAGARVVTLVGMGGIGKTRVALRYARDWLGDHPGGAWFCDLSTAQSLDGVAHAVAHGLDMPLGKADPLSQIGEAIAGRGVCLVVLDNFEQVARHAEATLGPWLARAPSARFLVTSRERLGITGEVTRPLAPLELDEAVRLFEARAVSVAAQVQGEERAVVLPTLVEMLDRLPLAIELAAARTRVMRPRAMLDRMGERFKLLATAGNRLDRQATLRATLDWSWELLSPVDQELLMQLTVFEGGFTLEAAEAVVDSGAAWTADVLQGLVEKSLVCVSSAGRFSFLRTVHDYLVVRADGQPQRAAEQRHARYFAGLNEAQAVAQRGAEIDNLVLACQRAAPDEAAIAVHALANLWAALRMTGPFRSISPQLAAVEARGTLLGAELALLHAVAAGLLHQTGDLAQALERAGTGARCAAQAGDARLEAMLGLVGADVLRSLGHMGESMRMAQQALACAETGGDAVLQLQVLNSLGTLHYFAGEHAKANAHYDRALALARAAGHDRWIGGVLGNLALLHQAKGQPEQALSAFQEALALAQLIGDRQWEGNNRSNYALLQHEMGRSRAAADQLGQALRIAREIGHARLERLVLCNLGIVQAALGEHALARASFEQAVMLCVAAGDQHSEAAFRGYLALERARTGDVEHGEQEAAQAIMQIRAVDDPSALALLLAQGAAVAAIAADMALSAQRDAECRSLLLGPGAGNRAECLPLLQEAERIGAGASPQRRVSSC